MPTIAIANQKGGVGKTTTAVNLSTALSMQGYNTLLVDADPQTNSTASFIDTEDITLHISKEKDNLRTPIPISNNSIY